MPVNWGKSYIHQRMKRRDDPDCSLPCVSQRGVWYALIQNCGKQHIFFSSFFILLTLLGKLYSFNHTYFKFLLYLSSFLLASFLLNCWLMHSLLLHSFFFTLQIYWEGICLCMCSVYVYVFCVCVTKISKTSGILYVCS